MVQGTHGAQSRHDPHRNIANNLVKNKIAPKIENAKSGAVRQKYTCSVGSGDTVVPSLLRLSGHTGHNRRGQDPARMLAAMAAIPEAVCPEVWDWWCAQL
jgi:hypothetical protein